MMNLGRIVLHIILFFFILYKSAGYDSHTIDSFFNLSDNEINRNFENFILAYVNLNADSTLKIFNKISSKIPDKESREYVIILTQISSAYSKLKDSIKFERTNRKALKIATKNDYYNELIGLYIIRAEYFKEKDILDSALYYCLVAEDISQKIENYNSYKLNHILGDIYYYLEMYDEAKLCYNKVIESGKELPSWIEWRKIVIYTNLGNMFTIQEKNNIALNYYNIAAEQYFKNKNNNSNYFAYIQGAHLFGRIANMYHQINNLDSAKKYADISVSYLEKDSLLKENYSYVYTIAGKIYSGIGEFIKADEFLQIAQKNISKNNPDKLFDVYLALSINNERLGLLHEALMYRKKYDSSYNEFRKKNNYAKLMQIKLVGEFSQVKNELEKQRIVNKIFYLISLFLAVIVLILYYFNKKVHKGYKLISSKTLEIIKQKKLITQSETIEDSKNHSEIANNENNRNEALELSQELIDLAIKIQNTLLDNPIIFNNEFNINDLSNLLNTNRDYISKAINGYYKVSFQIFLNELRVIAAINLMKNNRKSNLTMDYFMEKVGFSNRATFSASFKRYTGMTPAVFYKTLSTKE